MSTYNEKLRSGVVASLQSQELACKASLAKLNAAMFTLYYAGAAAINANEQVMLANDEAAKKLLVKQAAVIAANISNNQLLSATRAGQYAKQAVTNTALCAANVQIASNAIVKLAGDLGSIWSILNAAGADSTIFTQAREARDLINKTAYEAEAASAIAMKVSALMSEVSTETVMTASVATNKTMDDVLNITGSEQDAASQIVMAAVAAATVETAKQKTAEENFEDAKRDRYSADEAYDLANKALNLNLIAEPGSDGGNSVIIVRFDPIDYPFGPAPKPIQDYYVFFSKDASKETIEIGNAENLLLDKQSQITVKVPTALGAGNITQTIKYNEMTDDQGNLYTLKDTDGDDIKPGIPYVAFVIGAYKDEYKKKVNDHDDFLSAPSPAFTITNSLAAVQEPVIIKAIPGDTDATRQQARLEVPAAIAAQIKTDGRFFIAFNVTEVTGYSVDYRCMFLPVIKSATRQMSPDRMFGNGNLNTSAGQHSAPAHSKPGFIFDLTLAEQVVAGNYITAEKFPVSSGKSKNQKARYFCMGSIGPDTTDIFGNLLVTGNSYYPIVLSFSTAPRVKLSMFKNALTDLNRAEPVTYSLSGN